jgi:ankyrin repeat protein
LLLDHGADIEQRGINDCTALHLAASQGDLGLVDLLLAHGADPNSTTRIDDPVTPLEEAEAAGHVTVADCLRPLTTRLDWEAASASGATRELRRLLDKGHDVNATDAYIQTALMRSAHAGHLAAVELLIQRGADLDRTAKYGLSALMLAVIAGHHHVARLLVRAGADLSITGTGAPGFATKTAADLAEAAGDLRLAGFIRSRT